MKIFASIYSNSRLSKYHRKWVEVDTDPKNLYTFQFIVKGSEQEENGRKIVDAIDLKYVDCIINDHRFPIIYHHPYSGVNTKSLKEMQNYIESVQKRNCKECSFYSSRIQGQTKTSEFDEKNDIEIETTRTVWKKICTYKQKESKCYKDNYTSDNIQAMQYEQCYFSPRIYTTLKEKIEKSIINVNKVIGGLNGGIMVTGHIYCNNRTYIYEFDFHDKTFKVYNSSTTFSGTKEKERWYLNKEQFSGKLPKCWDSVLRTASSIWSDIDRAIKTWSTYYNENKQLIELKLKYQNNIPIDESKLV